MLYRLPHTTPFSLQRGFRGLDNVAITVIDLGQFQMVDTPPASAHTNEGDFRLIQHVVKVGDPVSGTALVALSKDESLGGAGHGATGLHLALQTPRVEPGGRVALS